MLEQYYKIKGEIPRYVVASNLETNFEIYNSILEKCFMVENKQFDYAVKIAGNSVEYSGFHQNLQTAMYCQHDLDNFIKSYHLGYFTHVLSLYQRCISESVSMHSGAGFTDALVKLPAAPMLLDEVVRVLTYSKIAMINGKQIDIDELDIDETGIHGFAGTGTDYSMNVLIGWDLFLFSVARGE